MMLRTALSALLVLTMPTAAWAQGQPCLSSAEATSLVSALLPDGLTVAVDKCRPHLPADAYLVRSGGDLVARYRVEAERSFAQARPALAKLMGSGGDDLMKKLDDETARKVFAAGIASAIEKDIKPSTCPDIDRIAAALDPLPPRNMGLLVGAILDLTARDKKAQKGPFAICQPVTAASR